MIRLGSLNMLPLLRRDEKGGWLDAETFGEVLLPPGARTGELRLRRAEGDEKALALYRMES